MKNDTNNCQSSEYLHKEQPLSGVADEILEDAISIFSAMGDTARLKLLILLHEGGECCVSELADQLGEKINTVSMRLKKLYDADLVSKRREAQHILYRLKDDHIVTILRNAIDHAQHSLATRSAAIDKTD